MSLSVILFVLCAVLLIGLLVWTSRPLKRQLRPTEDIFSLLSQSRHCSRLPYILQALRPEDTACLQANGKGALMHTVRQERRRIARKYLDQLEEEFALLLDISRALAVMAPEVIAMEEIERWKLNVRFALSCALLRWRLRLGLEPLPGFTLLSNMASSIIRQLEAATTRIAETAARSAEIPEAASNGSEDL